MNTTHKSNCNSKSKAFTLVELLVVIAIISILAGMLLPALENALGSARKIACANNLKNMSLAENYYASDYDDYILAVKLPGFGYWCNTINNDDHSILNYITKEILICPTTELPVYSAGMPTTYGLCSTKNGGGPSVPTYDISYVKKRSYVKSPGLLMRFGDSAEDGTGTSRYAIGTTPNLGYWHSGFSNFILLDGHYDSAHEYDVGEPNTFWVQEYCFRIDYIQ